MPNDLRDFYESDLNNSNLIRFCNTLSSGAKQKFRDSLGGYQLDNDSLNVLQGYRGPYPDDSSGDSEKLESSNGLQEVQYRWGTSKHANWVPVAGWIAFGIGRAAGDTSWRSIYFDSKTGECLSHDKNTAASELNNQGNNFYKQEKYDEAAEYFKNAYYSCTSGNSNEQSFKSNWKLAEAAILKVQTAKNLFQEGCELHNVKKNYSEAAIKFQEAYNACPKDHTAEKTYKDSLDQANALQAKVNLAKKLFAEGCDLHNVMKNFSEAAMKFKEAYNTCPKDHADEATYKNSLDRANALQDKVNLAKKLFAEGCELHNVKKNFSEAAIKFKEAYNTCPKDHADEATYKDSLDRANALQAKVNLAKKLFAEGCELHNVKKNYSEAAIKFKEAYNTCPKDHADEKTYKDSLDRANALQDKVQKAKNLFKEGCELHNIKENYSKAAIKFKEAYNICPNDHADKATYKDSLDRAKKEEAAQKLASEKAAKKEKARKLASEKIAKEELARKLALDKTAKEEASRKLAAEKAAQKFALEQAAKVKSAQKLFHEGYELYNMKKQFVVAALKFKQAFDICPNDHADKETYRNYINLANAEQVKVDIAVKNSTATKLNEKGLELFNQGNYCGAAEFHKNAYQLSSPEHEPITNFENNWYNAEAARLNQEGDTLKSEKKYNQAITKYRQAYDKCPNIKGVYMSYRKTYAENLASAEKAFKDGEDIEKAYIEKSLEELKVLAENPHQKGRVHLQDGWEIIDDTDAFQDLGCRSEADDLFIEAFNRFKEAIEIYPFENIRNSLEELIDACKKNENFDTVNQVRDILKIYYGQKFDNVADSVENLEKSHREITTQLTNFLSI